MMAAKLQNDNLIISGNKIGRLDPCSPGQAQWQVWFHSYGADKSEWIDIDPLVAVCMLGNGFKVRLVGGE